MPNLENCKVIGWFNVFRAGFLLQHFRGYKPFITKVTFTREFHGDLRGKVEITIADIYAEKWNSYNQRRRTADSSKFPARH